MDNPNPAKAAKVDEIAEKLEQAGTVLVTEYRGLDVPAQAQLRAAVKEAGGEFKIYKNTLAKLAAERTGVELDEHLTGPTALAFAMPGEDGGQPDPVSLSKALTEFAKTNEALIIKGGVMDGATIGNDDVVALSKVPPREEMLAKFAGLLQAPMANFAGLLNAMPTKLAQLTQALIEKGGAAPGAADEAPAAEEAAADEAAPAEEAAADDAAAEAPAEEAAEETDAAEAATEDAAEAVASEETEEPAAADSEETDDKED
jgi:large subunit ribosomal protein L10